MQQRINLYFSPFSTLIVFLTLSLVGLSFVPLLSVQLLPSRTFAAVTVTSQLLGASAQVTELELTAPLESTMASLSGVKSISSSSSAGYSQVTVQLDKWTDPEMFRFEAVAQMRQLYSKLPVNASYPQVYLNQPDPGDKGGPILSYTLHGPGSTNEIMEVAERNIRPLLAGLKGINELDISGDHPARLLVSTSTNSLHQAGIDFTTLEQTLRDGLARRGLGILHVADGRIQLFSESSLSSPDELSMFPLAAFGGRMIRLKDIASVETDEVPPTSHFRINGQQLISISIYPETHINNIRLAENAHRLLQSAENQLPSGYHLALSYDNTIYIKEELQKISVRTFLSITILILFVVLITRQLRYVLIVVVALTVNLALSSILYYLFQIEIHLYSLAGITISMGLIIDNVIVIVEDIRHTGRNRIFAAILASTLTALGALSVIFLLEESLQLNLIDFALAVIISLLVSLPVAYFFIPALLQQFPISIRTGHFRQKRLRKLAVFNRFYRWQLRFMQRYRMAFFVGFILAFGLPLFLLPEKIEKETQWASIYNRTIGSAFYRDHLREPLNTYLGGALYLYIKGYGKYHPISSSEEAVSLNINISMPNGSTLAQMDAVVQDFEQYLRQYDKELEVFTASVPTPTRATIRMSFSKDYDTGFPHRLKHLLEVRAVHSGAADFQIYGVGHGFNNTFNLNEYDSTIALKGYNYAQLQELALSVHDTLLQNPRVQDVVITSESRYNHHTLYDYVVAVTDPEHLALHGVGRYPLGNTLRTLEEKSQSIGRIADHAGRFTRVDLALNADNPPSVWETLHAPLRQPNRHAIRLGSVATLGQLKTGSNIRRENQQYILNVHYRFIGTYYLNDLVRSQIIKNLQPGLPHGYTLYNPNTAGRFWGQSDDVSSVYLWLLPLVLLMICMICAVLLESFTQPLAVVAIIPFSFIGVLLTFRMLGLRFDQGGYAAILILAGLVTNAALYIINDMNHYRKQYPMRYPSNTISLFKRAFHAKAMPILITTASAILSLLPFMISGAEKGFWFTLSAGTIGGLLFSLVGAYLLLPLCLIEKVGKRNKEQL